ncbi:hypothetical protein R3P38DRAFT_3178926 [Favolaschia claudopus]|uniref:Uncharacterized protein n=1 Tax=Favolaschia claudopus TaxID=2862362 RepID=A0AAW0CT79_9AGAR
MDFDFCDYGGPPRRRADEPPPLSPNSANLFDTFPRVCFGGYRRYYESEYRLDLESKNSEKSDSGPFEPSLSSIAEDPWSWQSLPKFSGTTRRTSRRANSGHRDSCPRLRKKPRFRPSSRPLVDATYYSWPDWLFSQPIIPLSAHSVDAEEPLPLPSDSETDLRPTPPGL